MTHLSTRTIAAANLLLAVLLLAALLPARTVAAESVALPHATLEIEPPAGYCALDPAAPFEAEVMGMVEAMQEGQNQVVMQFVECRELKLWRNGQVEGFTRFGQVMLPMSEGRVQAIPFERADFLAEMVNYLPSADDALLAEVERMANENDQGVTVEELQFLGVLEQDENALYVGLLGRPTFAGERGDMQAGLMAMTLVRSTVLASYLYRPYGGDADFDRLIAELQAHMAAVVSGNP